MTGKMAMEGSFKSLSHTLAFEFDMHAPEDVSSRWFGVMMHSAAVGRRTADWIRLPDESSDYAPTVAALDKAARELAVAKTHDAQLKALDDADAALDLVEGVLDKA
jgi:hypothetical protein